MLRALTLFGLALLAAAALSTAAAAKEMSVSLTAGGPASMDPGEPWTADLLVHGDPDILAEATPGVSIRGPGGEERTFPARATGKRAADGQLIYRTTVTFPSEGRWTYQLLDGVTERAYEGGIVMVGDVASAPAGGDPASPTPVAAAAEDDSFPLWPLLGGLIAAGLAAIVAVALVRRGRLAPER
jgi:hypothetical protein